MSEESKTPKKAGKLTPREAALIGVLTGVVCLGFVVVAKHVGVSLDAVIPGTTFTTQEGLIFGGMGALLGGVWGARLMPTKGEQ